MPVRDGNGAGQYSEAYTTKNGTMPPAVEKRLIREGPSYLH